MTGSERGDDERRETDGEAQTPPRRGRGRPAGVRRSDDVDPRNASTWPEVMTPDEVAQVLRLQGESVRQLLRDGVLPGRKIGGTWMITKTRLLAFLNNE